MKNSLSLVTAILMIYLPDQLMAVSLELRQAGGKVTDNTVMVGDEFEVELWVDSRDKILSGAAVFISFDPQHFELIQHDKGYLDELKPFLPGNFLANGEIFRNYLLDELDPAASTAGIQIDYSVVRATDQGAGALAKFGLRAISPTTSSEIKIDEMGSRETRFFLPDGNQDYFRYIKPLEMKVQGISLNNFPNKIVLRRSETQNINLKSYFFDPVFAIEDIEWNISPSNDIPAILDHKNHTLTFTAPQDHSPWQTIVITAKNPEGQIGSDTLNIFVNDPPIFESIDKITISEDSNFHINLNSIISDVDTEWTRLEWSSIAGSKVDIQLDDEKQRATIWPEQNWYGTDLVRLIATDNFSFSDTLQLEIEIEPINDPPTLLFAPNIQLIPGRSDQSIRIENLIDDSEDNYSKLVLTWSGEENAQLSVIDGLLTISSKPGWYGTEEIQLRVEDTEGKYSTGLLTVTISPTMPPTTLEIPSRIFISAGKEEIIDLNNWVTDPDDDDGMLTWEITGNQSVSFQINSQKMGLINSPREFVGIETLNFQVTDLSGGITVFDVDIYSLPPDGTPLFAKLPELQVPINGVNSSLNLDDYIFDFDNDPEELSFYLPENKSLNLRVDPQSRVLIVEPKEQILAGTITVDLQVTDPLGNQANQNIIIHIIDTNRTNENTFSFVRFDTIKVSKNESQIINLDQYIIEPETIGSLTWRIEPLRGIDTQLNGNNLTVRRNKTPIDKNTIKIYASINNGPEEIIRIQIVENPSQNNTILPLFLSTNSLSLSSGSIDSSIFISDLISDFRTEDFIWEITGGNHTQAVINPETDQIIINAGEHIHTGERFLLSGKRSDGFQVEAFLDIFILSDKNNHLFEKQYTIGVFSDQNEARVSVEHILLDHDDNIEKIQWEIPDDNLAVFYDSVRAEVILSNTMPWHENQQVELKATNAEGISENITLTTNVFSVEDKNRLTHEDFYVVLVPNILQPDFIDIFVVNKKENLQPPRLRILQRDWHDIPLNEISKEISHGFHTLDYGQEGSVEILALTTDNSNLYSSQYTFDVGSIPNGRGKLITNSNLAIDLNPGAFSSDAVLAFLPEDMGKNHPELVQVSSVYNIYSPQKYIPNGSRLSIKIPHGVYRNIGLYKYHKNNWIWVHSSNKKQHLEANLNSLGRFALFSDSTKPKIIREKGFNWLITDEGSGLSIVEIFHGGTPLNSDSYNWDGKKLSVYSSVLDLGKKSLQVRAIDNVGNIALLDIKIKSNNLPSTPILMQNFPNPFNPSTSIPIILDHRLPVLLEIFNITGQKTRSLIDEFLNPGVHEIIWDSRDDSGNLVSSGVYVYRLTLPNQSLIRKMTLVR